MGAGGRAFSVDAERAYYRRKWPTVARPYSHLRKYLRRIGITDRFQGKRVLEIGAGESQYARLFAEELGSELTCALDLFPERMRPAVRTNQNPRLKFMAGNCYELPFQDASFEVVFGNLVLHHLPQLDRVIREIRRVLVPGGVYVGIEPNVFNPVVVVVSRFFLPRSPNEYVLSPAVLRQEFGSAGFSASTGFFWSRFPRLRSRFLATCVWVLASNGVPDGQRP